MNDFCRSTSALVQSLKFKRVFENEAMSKSAPRNKRESAMLKKFAAALVATGLIAGPAFAQSTGNPSVTPISPAATQAAPSVAAKPTVKPAAKTAKTVKHSARHVRKHAARSTTMGAATHQARHVKPGTASKTHQAGAAQAGEQS